MTVKELIIETWNNLGRQTTYQPLTDVNDEDTFDLTLDGSAKLLSWLNRAYKRLAFWKGPDNTYLKFPAFYSTLNFKTTSYAGTLSTATTTTFTFPASFTSGTPSSTDDYYNDWLIEITGGTGAGQLRLIADYTGASLTGTVSFAFDTSPDDTSEFSIYKSFFDIVPSTDERATDSIALDPIDQIFTVQRIIDLEEQQFIEHGSRTDDFANNLITPGEPTLFVKEGNRIVFNYAIDTPRWYRMEYLKIPTDLTLETDEPLLPEAWHEVIIAYMTWIGHKQNMENDAAWSWRQDMERLIQTLIQPDEIQFEKEDCGFVIDYDRSV